MRLEKGQKGATACQGPKLVVVVLVVLVVVVYAKPTNLAGPINKLQDMK